MKKRDGIFIIIALVVLVLLYLNGLRRDEILETDHVFVLAKVYEIENNSDNLNFCYRYKYKGKEYSSCISTLDISMQDSLIIIKISSNDPSINSRTNQKIPNCILEDPKMDIFWNEFPLCN